MECGDLTSTPAGLPGWGPRFTALVGRDLSRPRSLKLFTEAGRQAAQGRKR